MEEGVTVVDSVVADEDSAVGPWAKAELAETWRLNRSRYPGSMEPPAVVKEVMVSVGVIVSVEVIAPVEVIVSVEVEVVDSIVGCARSRQNTPFEWSLNTRPFFPMPRHLRFSTDDI